MSTKILFVRHGSTRLNQGSGQTGSSECIRGWLDVPLSPEGRQEAQAAGEKLKEHEFDCIVSSDLSRAADTARAISKKTGVPLVGLIDGLRPWDVGELAGKVVKDCLDILVDDIRNKPDEPMPSGESFNDFKERFLGCIDAIRRKHPDETVCVVSHHRCERLLQAWKETGGDPSEDINPDAFLRPGIGPGEFREFTLGKGGDSDGDVEITPNYQSRYKAKPAAPTPPWNAKPIEPRTGGPQKDLWSYSYGGKNDGAGLTKDDPLDLKPPVPLRKRSQSWDATILADLKKGL
jgi:probable phosphoglycerate mutase